MARNRGLSLSVDWDRLMSAAGDPTTTRKSISSYAAKQSIIEYKQEVSRTFPTGSKYQGQWDSFGMTGFGTYVMPHGVEYEGYFLDGMFDGEGCLTYPNGKKINGIWVKGRMVESQTDVTVNSEFCSVFDRRMGPDLEGGLQPAGAEFDNDSREIPEGCLDTTDGFYDTVTGIVFRENPSETRLSFEANIFRIPTAKEQEWIEKNCRSNSVARSSIGPDAELYQFWVNGRSGELELLRELYEKIYKLDKQSYLTFVSSYGSLGTEQDANMLHQLFGFNSEKSEKIQKLLNEFNIDLKNKAMGDFD